MNFVNFSLLRDPYVRVSKQRETLNVVDQKGTETIYSNSHLTGNTMALISYLSIVTLNVNGLNAPNQKTQGIRMDKKTKPINMLPTRNSF